MAPNDKKPTSALATTAAQAGFLAPEDISNIQRFIDGGFAEEKSFWIGDPADGKIPVYFGQLVGRGEDIHMEKMGAKLDPVTGEVPMQAIPTYNFHPLNPTTFEPVTSRLDTIICASMVGTACAKFSKIAADKGGTAQILFRWNGRRKTRKGFNMNDVDTLYRVVNVRQSSFERPIPALPSSES